MPSSGATVNGMSVDLAYVASSALTQALKLTLLGYALACALSSECVPLHTFACIC